MCPTKAGRALKKFSVSEEAEREKKALTARPFPRPLPRDQDAVECCALTVRPLWHGASSRGACTLATPSAYLSRDFLFRLRACHAHAPRHTMSSAPTAPMDLVQTCGQRVDLKALMHEDPKKRPPITVHLRKFSSEEKYYVGLTNIEGDYTGHPGFYIADSFQISDGKRREVRAGKAVTALRTMGPPKEFGENKQEEGDEAEGGEKKRGFSKTLDVKLRTNAQVDALLNIEFQLYHQMRGNLFQNTKHLAKMEAAHAGQIVELEATKSALDEAEFELRVEQREKSKEEKRGGDAKRIEELNAKIVALAARVEELKAAQKRLEEDPGVSELLNLRKQKEDLWTEAPLKFTTFLKAYPISEFTWEKKADARVKVKRTSATLWDGTKVEGAEFEALQKESAALFRKCGRGKGNVAMLPWWTPFLPENRNLCGGFLLSLKIPLSAKHSIHSNCVRETWAIVKKRQKESRREFWALAKESDLAKLGKSGPAMKTEAFDPLLKDSWKPHFTFGVAFKIGASHMKDGKFGFAAQAIRLVNNTTSIKKKKAGDSAKALATTEMASALAFGEVGADDQEPDEEDELEVEDVEAKTVDQVDNERNREGAEGTEGTEGEEGDEAEGGGGGGGSGGGDPYGPAAGAWDAPASGGSSHAASARAALAKTGSVVDKAVEDMFAVGPPPDGAGGDEEGTEVVAEAGEEVDEGVEEDEGVAGAVAGAKRKAEDDLAREDDTKRVRAAPESAE